MWSHVRCKVDTRQADKRRWMSTCVCVCKQTKLEPLWDLETNRLWPTATPWPILFKACLIHFSLPTLISLSFTVCSASLSVRPSSPPTPVVLLDVNSSAASPSHLSFHSCLCQSNVLIILLTLREVKRAWVWGKGRIKQVTELKWQWIYSAMTGTMKGDRKKAIYRKLLGICATLSKILL